MTSLSESPKPPIVTLCHTGLTDNNVVTSPSMYRMPIVKHCTDKGYIPLRNGRKKVAKQSILIRVKFFRGLKQTYVFIA